MSASISLETSAQLSIAAVGITPRLLGKENHDGALSREVPLADLDVEREQGPRFSARRFRATGWTARLQLYRRPPQPRLVVFRSRILTGILSNQPAAGNADHRFHGPLGCRCRGRLPPIPFSD